MVLIVKIRMNIDGTKENNHFELIRRLLWQVEQSFFEKVQLCSILR